MYAISMSINIPVCTSIETTACEDGPLQNLKPYIIQGWQQKKEEVAQDIRQYCPIKNELGKIDDIQ